ncbi:MAG: prephenate dehydratase [Desulforegulaceae bacterium]|nr:prephenate dehydratase [Desulforegulaceae bacterium]
MENITENPEIGKYRKEIDKIDDTILELLNKRLEFGRKIGAIKRNTGARVLDSSREKEILERLKKNNSGPLSEDVIYHIFQVIMSASRDIQNPNMVAYLGPEATNTHVAALKHFDYSGQFVPKKSIPDIFDGVEKGHFRYGVVPVENSIEGAVNHTLDLLFDSQLKICGETAITISHDLLSTCTSLSEIEVVYSHPQAFAQCRRWIKENIPDAELKEVSSTAAAARQAVTEKNSAAIANSEASRFYNLSVAASRIEDSTRNITRFLIIGEDEPERTGNDKTTIMFVTSHVPGALYKALQPVSAAGVNMVKLESRPIRHKNWHYFFVMDIDGHIKDNSVKSVIAEMREVCLFLKHSGSYKKFM